VTELDATDELLVREFELAQAEYRRAVAEYERARDESLRSDPAEAMALLRKALIQETEAARRYREAGVALEEHRRGRNFRCA
jgi:hypothetical protein